MSNKSYFQSSLEERVMKFLASLQGAECLDDSKFNFAGKKADYLLDERRIVMEVKSLIVDTEHKIQKKIDELMARGDFVAYGTFPLNYLLSKLPNGSEINRDIFHAVTKPIQDHFEKADDQIQNTKQALGIEDALGVLTILNENVGVLDPEIVGHQLWKMWAKKKDGKPRYNNIDCVWLHMESHAAKVDGTRAMPSMIITCSGTKDNPQALAYMESMPERFAAFNKVRLLKAKEGVTVEELGFKKFDEV